MIPQFPVFKCIEWNDKADVERFTREFPPYSDFNFVSLWSWNTHEKMQVSQLNGNLVLLFCDYISETPFLTFIGTTQVAETAHDLLEYSMRCYQVDFLKLVPATVAAHLPSECFKIIPDADSKDYIMSVSYLSGLNTYSRSSNPGGYFCQKFLRLYPNHIVHDCTVVDMEKTAYVQLFKSWAKGKSLDHAELNEYCAFDRFIHNAETGNRIVSLHDGNALIGFATYEILANNYAICHFAKGDKKYKGVYDGLFHSVAKILAQQHVLYWNFEQDLGIPSLRRGKEKYQPVCFLEKFIIQKL